mgnify:CR=1 FL=1
MKKNKKLLLWIGLPLLVLLIVLAVTKKKTNQGVKVATELVTKRTLIESVSANGKIQPEVDNIIATRIAKIVCESIPEVSTCLDFDKPDMHYVRTFRVQLPDGSFTSRGTNLYHPEPKNDLFDFNENDAIYQCRREEINGNKSGEEKIFTQMWNNDVAAVSAIRQALSEEF